AAKQWCFEKAKVPHPLLEPAIAVHLSAAAATVVQGDPGDGTSPSQMQQELVDKLIESQDEYDPLALGAAVRQIREFLLEIPDPQQFLDAAEPADLDAQNESP